MQVERLVKVSLLACSLTRSCPYIAFVVVVYCCHTGLRYDDLYDPLGDVDVAEALRRISPEEEMARNQRLRRALDLVSNGRALE